MLNLTMKVGDVIQVGDHMVQVIRSDRRRLTIGIVDLNPRKEGEYTIHRLKKHMSPAAVFASMQMQKDWEKTGPGRWR